MKRRSPDKATCLSLDKKSAGRAALVLLLCAAVLAPCVLLFPLAHECAVTLASAKDGWGHTFICEAKATDFAVAYFTYVLAIVTWCLWAAAKRQEGILIRSVAVAEEAAKAASESVCQAKAAFEEDRRAKKHEQFEALFFHMLSLTRELTDRIDVNLSSTRTREGSAALDALAAKVNNLARNSVNSNGQVNLKALVDIYQTKIYNRYPSALGPYFRLLYQTFKLVANSGLDDTEKVKYANIARGQISEGAVLLLALNGWAQYGYKFILFIEEFGLLEHMHPTYRVQYKTSLLEGYTERAFSGSRDRQRLALIEEPLHAEGYYSSNVTRSDEDLT